MQARRTAVWAISTIVGLAGSAAIVFLVFQTTLAKYRIWFDGDLAALNHVEGVGRLTLPEYVLALGHFRQDEMSRQILQFGI